MSKQDKRIQRILTCFCALCLLVILQGKLVSCNKIPASALPDLLLYNAYIYPVTGDPIPHGALTIQGGKIRDIGQSDSLLQLYAASGIELIDCKGNFLMPGFIEGHGHFSAMGQLLMQIDLLETKSWREIVDSVEARVKHAKPGEWITGFGWHQEKWTTKEGLSIDGYPSHDWLSKVAPDNPVLLSHASGHAKFANAKAMEIAGVSRETPDPAGGRIVRSTNGDPLGVFEENAAELVYAAYQAYYSALPEKHNDSLWFRSIQLAQEHCIRKGITTFEDAGSSFQEIHRYDSLAKAGVLDIRLWVMVRHPYDQLAGKMNGLPILRSGEDKFTCRAIKTEVDGALGSFGAWLLRPYNDKPGFTGQNTTSIEDVSRIAGIAMEKGMQLCVHAIGDRANQEVINIMEEKFQKNPDKKDLRWRIEHAQHLDTSDIPRFAELGIIASMQGIHCTSDSPYVVKRLGEDRARDGAYVWRSLLNHKVKIANGTDVPVERVDPLPNLYALLTRKRVDSDHSFHPEQVMTREEALYAYTLANAYAAFEEDIKGSIEKGKWADLVLVSQNLFSCPVDSILDAKIIMTMIGGKIKYDTNLH